MTFSNFSLSTEKLKATDDFNYYLNEKYFVILKPVIGTLWIEFAKKLEGISQLNKTEKTTKMVYSFKKKNTEDILHFLSETLKKHALEDNEEYNVRIKAFCSEANSKLLSLNIESFKSIQHDINLAKRLLLLLESDIRIENPYESELQKVTFKTFLFEARSIAMIFGILLSTFGISRFGSDQPSVKDNLLQYLSAGIPWIVAFFFIWGILTTYSHLQDVSLENQSHELEKAKSKLNRDLKMVTDIFINDWKTYLRDTFKIQIEKISAQAERHYQEKKQ